jgi:hypothetical protein
MNDDWRLEVDFDDTAHIGSLVERLDARELEHELSNAFHDRVVVSRDDDVVFPADRRPRRGQWQELVERIEEQAPAGSQVSLEGTWAVAYAERPANPFAIFGGMGG